MKIIPQHQQIIIMGKQIFGWKHSDYIKSLIDQKDLNDLFPFNNQLLNESNDLLTDENNLTNNVQWENNSLLLSNDQLEDKNILTTDDKFEDINDNILPDYVL